ncbi:MULTISPECIES: class B sortase [Caproicibacterium]|uniref:Class B sortase n=1 Tax=Caproicibacterium argilliputei TaxID=3030016 RepID=A0AA97H0D5_9FIRM|nr:class B sortase [Caproicibacterium argilliputei]WOC31426.1 class B sortase [Caproicibacterium argilliputei]
MSRSKKARKKRHIAFPLCVVSCFLAIDFFAFGLFFELTSRSESHKFYETLATRTVQPSSASAVKMTPQIDFQNLKVTCPSAVAWIYSSGTPIDYPVVQAKDNKFYLSHRADNTSNENGAVFLNKSNSPNFTDDNSILFAHHLATGDMFTSLEKYRDQAYYKEHPTMDLMTPSATYKVELIAGYVLDGDSPIFPTRFATVEAQEQFLQNARKHSVFTSKVQVTPKDRLLTLCTCTYDFDNARLAVIGKLVKQS